MQPDESLIGFEQVAAVMPDGVLVCDESGTIVLANDRLAELLGYRREELVGLAVDALVPDGLRERHGVHRRSYVASPTVRPMGLGLDLMARDRAGASIPVEVGLSPLAGPGTTFTVAVVRDMTARIAHDRERASESALYQTIVESISDLIFVTDENLRVTFANARALALTGRGMLDLVGRLLPIERHDVPDDVWATVVAGTASEGVEFDARLEASERASWLHVKVTPLRGTAGELLGTVVSATDVSERRMAEAARRRLEHDLFEAQKMEALGRLARGVAHDFNGILLAVGGTAALALERADDETRGDLEAILASAERARELTSQLVSFGRADEVAPETVDVRRSLLEMRPLLERLVGAGVGLQLECDDDVPHILAGRAHLDQIVMNLVRNASEAMPDGGEVTVFAARARAPILLGPGAASPDVVRVTVSDTGPGIDDDTLASLFEPFFSTKPGGTGLGLSIVYQLVSRWGGRVTASARDGGGAAFAVDLPAIAPVPTEAAGGGRAAADATRIPTRSRVLLVDDDDGVRSLGQSVLERGGFDVHVAESATSAIALVDSGLVPDLIVTDVVMPGEDGAALVSDLREHGALAPVIYVSGYSRAELAEGLGVRIPDEAIFLPKPFDAETLLRFAREQAHC